MDVLFQEKSYSFLEDKGIIVTLNIDRHQVYVKALYLAPEVFGTVPMYFLTTDIPENDYLARTITYKLYDSESTARIAQNIVLGVGGAKVVEALGGVETYHMNEAHALSLAFHLYSKSKNIDEVRKKIVFTTHTPEKAGNEEHNINLLEKMGFFCGLPLDEVRTLTGTWGDMFSHSLVALRFSKIANAVSALHGEVSREMWGEFSGICEITHVTNAQNKTYWQDIHLAKALEENDDEALKARKYRLKQRLINVVADQTGKLFDPNKIIVVWARRFAEYKRPDLIKRDIMRFNLLVEQKDLPIQIIWAGKPYPTDEYAKSVFNHLVSYTKGHPNCAVLTGYELGLSAQLKKGADVWLNNPRRPREASGTSGMTAAMNGAVNVSINDGWIPEFSKHGINS
jgi:starch phosphorylase